MVAFVYFVSKDIFLFLTILCDVVFLRLLRTVLSLLCYQLEMKNRGVRWLSRTSPSQWAPPAACTRTGGIRKRATPTENVFAIICREEGARVVPS